MHYVWGAGKRALGGRGGGGGGGVPTLFAAVRTTGPAPGCDPGEDGAHRHRRLDRDEDLGDDAADRRRDLGVDLVGRDLADRLVGLDPVADLDAPADDGALGDRHAHLGHGDVDERRRRRLSTRGAHGTPP